MVRRLMQSRAVSKIRQRSIAGYRGIGGRAREIGSNIFFQVYVGILTSAKVSVRVQIKPNSTVFMEGLAAQANYPDLLRRVVAWDAENEREIVLLTNLMEFGAIHHRCDLQGALANRTVLQGPQAKPALRENLTARPSFRPPSLPVGPQETDVGHRHPLGASRRDALSVRLLG
jgi:hypothetical protein